MKYITIKQQQKLSKKNDFASKFLISKRRVKIIITKKDIRKGERQSGMSCPIALAVNRKLKIKNVFVGSQKIENGLIEYNLPEKAKTFIEKLMLEKK